MPVILKPHNLVPIKLPNSDPDLPFSTTIATRSKPSILGVLVMALTVSLEGTTNQMLIMAVRLLTIRYSPSKQGVGVDDLLDEIGGMHAEPRSLNVNGTEGVAEKAPEFNDLIPGFGASSVTNNGRSSTEMNKPSKPSVTSNKPAVTSHDDPFLVFETASSKASSESFLDSLEQISKLNNSKGTRSSSSTSPSLRSSPKPLNVSNSNKVNNSSVSSIDELAEFAMGWVQNSPSRRASIHTGEIKQNSAAKTNKSKGAPNARANQSNDMYDDLESFFSTSSRSTSAPKSRPTAMDDIFYHQAQNKGRPEMSQRVPSGSLPMH